MEAAFAIQHRRWWVEPAPLAEGLVLQLKDTGDKVTDLQKARPTLRVTAINNVNGTYDTRKRRRPFDSSAALPPGPRSTVRHRQLDARNAAGCWSPRSSRSWARQRVSVASRQSARLAPPKRCEDRREAGSQGRIPARLLICAS